MFPSSSKVLLKNSVSPLNRVTNNSLSNCISKVYMLTLKCFRATLEIEKTEVEPVKANISEEKVGQITNKLFKYSEKEVYFMYGGLSGCSMLKNCVKMCVQLLLPKPN